MQNNMTWKSPGVVIFIMHLWRAVIKKTFLIIFSPSYCPKHIKEPFFLVSKVISQQIIVFKKHINTKDWDFDNGRHSKRYDGATGVSQSLFSLIVLILWRPPARRGEFRLGSDFQGCVQQRHSPALIIWNVRVNN